MRAIVLAAGKGTRLLKQGEELPKAMKPMAGKPLLGYVLDSIGFIDKKDTFIVVGYKKETIIDVYDGYGFVVQDQQLGTGHAVKVCESAFADYNGSLLIAFGDMPLVKKETYELMLSLHKEQGNDCTMLTGITDLPLPYGRIIRDGNGKFVGVVEQKDCNEEQLKIRELNPSVYVFDSKKLFEVLGRLRNENAQKEYYLTDAPALMQQSGMKLGTYTIKDDIQIRGINTPEDLAACEALIG